MSLPEPTCEEGGFLPERLPGDVTGYADRGSASRPWRRPLLRFLKLALIFELSTILGLSVLTGQFFYRAYNNSSREHLPVSFLAALVMLVLGTQQTAMSFRREKIRLAFGRPTVKEKLRLKVAYSTLTLLLFIAAGVLLVILRNHLR
jgi:hypothetical protein